VPAADAGLTAVRILVALWVAVAVVIVFRPRPAANGVRTPVLLATGSAVALLAGHVAVVEAVEHNSAVALLDPPVHAWIIGHRTGALDSLMTTVSNIGGGVGMTALAVVTAALLWRHRRRAEAAVVVVAPPGAQLLSDGFKLLYERPRPPVADQLVVSTSYALPSGHTLGATVVLGVVAAVGVLSVRGRLRQAGVVAVAAAGMLLIGASRLYLGVHWPTDVESGYLLGGAWLALCVGALVVVRRRGAPAEAPLADAETAAGQEQPHPAVAPSDSRRAHPARKESHFPAAPAQTSKTGAQRS
jgi:undecaprenyl-diphosphatase